MSDSDEWRLLDDVIEYADESAEDAQSCAFDDDDDDDDEDDDRADAEQAAPADVGQSDEDWMGGDGEDHDQDDATEPAYTCESIQVLTGLQCVRKRPGMYVGDTTDGSGLHQLIWQLVDEVIDLHVAGEASELRVELASGWAVVHDDGLGIPVDMVPQPTGESISVLERVFTILNSRRAHYDRYRPSGGLHGVGLAAVNALSERLEVETTYEGVRWAQAFARGERVMPVRRVGPTSREGTTIRIRPDPDIFTRVAFDPQLVERRLEQLAWLYPHLRIWFQERRLSPRGGIAGWVRSVASKRGEIELTQVIRSDIGDIRVELAFAWNAAGPALVRSFVNGDETPLGGTHVNGLWPGFGLYAQSLEAPATRLRHVREAIGSGLVAVVHVQLEDPRFNCTREQLLNEHVGEAVRDAVVEALDKRHWTNWALRRYLDQRLLVAR